MADRKAEYRFRNGTVWDRLFFYTVWEQIGCGSKTLNKLVSDKVFGLAISENITTSLANFDAQFDKTLPYGFVNNCDYAAQSGIAAKILKSGLYYIDAHIYITGTNDTNFSLTVTQNGTDLCVANDNLCWGAFHLNVQSIEKLNANDLIKVKANRQQGSTAAYVMQTAFTHLILYPIALD